jgi:hypothetical protein
MKRPLLIFTAVVWIVGFGTPALAGVADSPLPELLPGETTYHLYTVPGVMGSGCFGTYFACTSLEKTDTMQVGVGGE